MLEQGCCRKSYRAIRHKGDPQLGICSFFRRIMMLPTPAWALIHRRISHSQGILSLGKNLVHSDQGSQDSSASIML